MSYIGEEKPKKAITGALDTQNHLKVVLAVKDLLETLLDPQQQISAIHPGAIPALQKLLAKARSNYATMSDEYLLVSKALPPLTGNQGDQAAQFSKFIERYATLLSLFNSSRITRETANIDRAAELHVFVSALVEAAGGPKTISSSL